MVVPLFYGTQDVIPSRSEWGLWMLLSEKGRGPKVASKESIGCLANLDASLLASLLIPLLTASRLKGATTEERSILPARLAPRS